MPDLGMLRHDEILQDGSRSDDTILEMLYTKTFQILRFKMFQKFLPGGGLCKSQSSSSKVKNLLPKFPSNIPRLPRSKVLLWARSYSIACLHSQKALLL